MPYRKTVFENGNFYHIYNRGANRKNIFQSDENYRFMLEKIGVYTTKHRIAVIAYCLMPNHYHFLLRQDHDIPISTFIQSIFNSYTKAFNKMHHHSGTLFACPNDVRREGRFKSILVDSEEYLTHLCRYIHRNPIDGRKPMVRDILVWSYSNYSEWIGQRDGSLVDRDFIRTHFSTGHDYEKFVLDYSPDEKLTNKLEKYYLD